jgi:integrase/recombinase XerD
VKPLEQALHDYLRIRRSCGYQLQKEESLLGHFVALLQAEGAPYISRELALRWATLPAKAQPFTWAQRLGKVRRFALWLSATDPRTEIPAPDLLPHRYRRKPPHIYSDEEIAKLLAQAQKLPSRKGLRAHTYATLFGLLTVTGMRLGEALGLDRADVDLDLGILHIRQGKCRKSRYVPVHPSTVEVLKRYAEARDRLFRAPAISAFFLSELGRRITKGAAEYTFAVLSQQIGLRVRAPVKGKRGHGPRLHDMRHYFAACTLVRWYRAGLDVERELPKLTTYLGHVCVTDTYWYLEAVPELLQLAAERLIPREVRS